MMKRLLFVVMIVLLTTAVRGQDTVRYGDPWYAFNPVTVLFAELDGYHPYPTYSCENMSDYYNRNVHLFLDTCRVPPRHYSIQGFENNDYTVYGIALTTNRFPFPDTTTEPLLLLISGLQYQVADSVWMNPGSYPVFASNPMTYYLHLTGVNRYDTLRLFSAPRRQCWFDYHYGYNFVTHTAREYECINTSQCHEFYFDTPVHIEKGSSTGGGSSVQNLTNKFYIGGRHCGHALPDVYSGDLHPDGIQLGEDSSLCQPWIEIFSTDEYGNWGQDYSGVIQESDSIIGAMGPLRSGRIWGIVFPIIRLRCTAPQLWLAERGNGTATVACRQNESPEMYQFGIGRYGSNPDTSTRITTTDTFCTFTNLMADTLYSVWVRKACRYTTAGYDTLVWSDWSAPKMFAVLGIDEVDEQGVRVYGEGGMVCVDGVEGREVRVYDMLGREMKGRRRDGNGGMRYAVPTAGVYVVHIDDLPARKVVVMR